MGFCFKCGVLSTSLVILLPVILFICATNGRTAVSDDTPDIRSHPWNLIVNAWKRETGGIIYQSTPGQLTKDPSIALPTSFVKALERIQSARDVILQEYLNYEEKVSTVKPCWEFLWQKTLWVNFFGLETGTEPHFGKTLEIIGPFASSSFFAEISPGAQFHPHIGFTAGLWRYHVTLLMPDDAPTPGPPKWLHKDGEIKSAVHLAVQKSSSLGALSLEHPRPFFFDVEGYNETLRNYKRDYKHDNRGQRGRRR